MIRKILTLLTALSLLLTLAACGGSTPAPPEDSAIPSDDVTATPMPSPVPDKGTPPAETPEAPVETPTVTPGSTPAVSPSAEPVPSAAPVPSETPQPEPAGVTCASIWSSIQSQLGGSMPDFMSGSADDLLGLYGIESSNIEDFSLNMPMMMVHATEIFIAKAAPDCMDTVKAGVALRRQNLLDQWSTYLPEQYDLVAQSQTVISGDYILFVIAEDAQSVADIFTAATAA